MKRQIETVRLIVVLFLLTVALAVAVWTVASAAALETATGKRD